MASRLSDVFDCGYRREPGTPPIPNTNLDLRRQAIRDRQKRHCRYRFVYTCTIANCICNKEGE